MANSAKTTGTAKKREKFLAALSETGNVSRAAQLAGIGRQTVYTHKKSDTEFSKAWDAALDEAADLLEEEARRRAYAGVEEPVYYQGKRVDLIRKYSDTLMIFLLKGCRPEKYADHRRVEHTGEGGGPITLKHEVSPDIREVLNEVYQPK
jgi:hypothetical protein